MGAGPASVTIYVNVIDSAQLIATARAKFIEDQRLVGGRRVWLSEAREAELPAEAEAAIDDVSAALRWLFDPGNSPAGCEILDSSAEVSFDESDDDDGNLRAGAAHATEEV
jgi:hypothetical protein